MSTERSGIAIIGMACKFPGAPDLETFHSNLEKGVDAITDAPPGRLDEAYFDPHSTAIDRIYCRRGGFLGEAVFFDPTPFGIMPIAAEGAEPDQMLALELVATALKDAGLDTEGKVPKETTSVIFGRGGYFGSRGARANQQGIFAQQLTRSIAAILPELSSDQLATLKQEFTTQLGHYGADTAIGLVPNIAASIVASRFDFGGSAYTIDAACASTLIAVDHAIKELETGRADLVVTGGMHLCYDLAFWNVFSRLGAISRSHQIRPFDRRADGLLIGEGIGVLVLARRADAERRGDRIYALIQGSGISSDGRGKSLMLPRSTGQLLALRRAWRSAAMEPATIGLLEAHGTGTPDGDRTELETIRSFFGGEWGSRPALGTVKSMIGHAMPAAGAAGLIKVALAIHHGFLPPTLHCEEPSELVAGTGFQLLNKAIPWPDDLPCRAGVNAFGFGGINAHLVVDSWPRRSPSPSTPPLSTAADMLLLSAETPEALLLALEARKSFGESGPCRLAIERPTPDRIALAEKIINRGLRWSGKNGIWFTPRGLAQDGGRIVFLYPGYDGRFDPQLESLCHYLRREPPPYHDAREDLRTVSIGVMSLGWWLTDIIEFLGIHPQALAGHSVGEWAGMVVSGIIDDKEADRFVEQVVPAMELKVPGVIFAAAGCGVEQGEVAIAGLPEISVSHDNCPHQIILCGIESSIDLALERLRGSKVLCEKLSFRSGFHSPLFKPYLDPLHEHFRSFSYGVPKIPLWSATTIEPYPADSEALNRLYVDHLLQRVRFRELTERLYATGHRVFVQVGMGRLLGFVEDTLPPGTYVTVSALVEQWDGLHQLRRLAAELWCEGYLVNLDRIGLHQARQALTQKTGKAIRLELSTIHPVLSASNRPKLKPAAEPLGEGGAGIVSLNNSSSSDPVLRELAAVTSALASMSQEVVAAWDQQGHKPRSQASGGRLEPRQLKRTERYSVAAIPEVIDHCFIRQPKDWPRVGDRFPVVPLTRSIYNLVELAGELVPELIPIEIERIRANRWIEVDPPVDVEIKADFDGQRRVDIKIGDYLEGTVILAPAYPPAPAPRPLDMASGPHPCVTAVQHYEDRWTFHGPAFRGLIELGPMTEKGVSGKIQCLPARGALLDAAGQLAGYWCTAHTTRDRLALPYRIDRIRFFSHHPPPGTHLGATIHVHELTDVWLRTDAEIYQNNKVWARVEGLEDRRFQSDDRFFRTWQYPSTHIASITRAEGYALVRESWRTAASRYFIARLYLGSEELDQYQAKPVAAQRAWLLGRVVVKDAVRTLLWERGYGEIFPIQIQVSNDGAGRPLVTGPWDGDIRVSLAHKETIGVAVMAEGADPGIDVEKVEPRDAAFLRAAFQESEIALLPTGDRDEWVTRLWVAKEAVAKARGGGLKGKPRDLLLTEIQGHRLRVDGTWVETRREGHHIVGWTLVSNLWQPQSAPSH